MTLAIQYLINKQHQQDRLAEEELVAQQQQQQQQLAESEGEDTNAKN